MERMALAGSIPALRVCHSWRGRVMLRRTARALVICINLNDEIVNEKNH